MILYAEAKMKHIILVHFSPFLIWFGFYGIFV